jgi:rubrerythrin
MQKFSTDEIIELAIQIERNGFLFYDHALKRKDLNERSRELLELLRAEEIEHEKTFIGLRSKDTDQMGDLVNWQEAASYLKTIAGTHIFNKQNAAIKLAVEAEDQLAIIKNAIQFEKDTLLFFHSIYRTTEDVNSQEIINRIIKEEVSHVTKLIEIAETFK